MTCWDTQRRPDSLREDEVHLWLVPLTAEPEQFSYYRSILSADEKERAERFRRICDRRRRVVTWGSLRYLLAAYGGGAPARVQFTRSPLGKPGLSGQTSNTILEFSLSHSEERALLGFTLGRRIGVDLEYIRPELDVLSVAEAYFARGEFQQLRSLPSGEQREAFYCAWTQKEAYLKACGAGLSLGLDRVGVTFNCSDWRLTHLLPEPGYLGAAAVEGSGVTFQFFRLEHHLHSRKSQ